MTTAQQLGLVGNSVRVQTLPTASAETFGQGNRYYTLIGQQEGYITGHTYHTVVANDVYSWEDVAGGASDYNQLDNIPVINQDLSASGFTPVANTYYRHTGATTDTFTQGVIYLYDTAYHKLGESGGGTLNRYEASITVTNATAGLLYNIFKNCKGNIVSQWRVSSYNETSINLTYSGASNVGCSTITFTLHQNSVESGYTFSARTDTSTMKTTQYNPINRKINIIYYNDTEITA